MAWYEAHAPEVTPLFLDAVRAVADRIAQNPRQFPPSPHDTRRALYRERVGWIRAEQEAGRLPEAFDPEMLYLMLVGASVYPVILPRVCQLVTGATPADDDFASHYREQLRLLSRALAGDA